MIYYEGKSYVSTVVFRFCLVIIDMGIKVWLLSIR